MVEFSIIWKIDPSGRRFYFEWMLRWKYFLGNSYQKFFWAYVLGMRKLLNHSLCNGRNVQPPVPSLPWLTSCCEWVAPDPSGLITLTWLTVILNHLIAGAITFHSNQTRPSIQDTSNGQFTQQPKLRLITLFQWGSNYFCLDWSCNGS